uniref:F-box protein 47 n=1 Tax=Acanthochromis polyacanthus TaxID=80966 RepID=A0A3Q1FDW0_9TELE
MVKKEAVNFGKYKWPTKSQRYKKTHHEPVRTIITRSQSASSGSFFHRVPAEVFDMILDKLSVRDISVLSMVSKDITRTVVDYISTLAWRNKTVIQHFHQPSYLEQKSTIEHYKTLGILTKVFFLFCIALITAPHLSTCFKHICYGQGGVLLIPLQTLIAGWDELECHRVFNFLCELTNLLQKIEAVITAKPGWHQELQLRLFCRQVLLDPRPSQLERQFWLVQLLKPLPMVSQAHLLFILYGPLRPEGTLGWQDLVERGLPHVALWDLAKAILVLFDQVEVKGWTTDSMLAVLEELTVIPQPWHVENVARLLVLCGSNLCYTFLASKALSGRLTEISRLIVYIVLVCEKDGYHMNWPVKLVQQISKVFSTAPDKFCFIQELENMFSEVTREFFEFSVAGNHFDNREIFATLSILLDASAHFHANFIHMFLQQELHRFKEM